MTVRVLVPAELFPEERVMWHTAESQTAVPSWYVQDLLFKLQEVRNVLEKLRPLGATDE